MKTAYIAVDVQNDFVEGGNLGVTGGCAAGRKIAAFLLGNSHFDFLIATRDWHIDPGEHFEKWPAHCVANTDGAEMLEELKPAFAGQNYKTVSKGLYSDGYSGFEGTNLVTRHMLDTILWELGIDHIVIGGIATDHCVRATALDGIKKGFRVTIITDHCAGVDETTTAKALVELDKAGVTLLTEEEYLTLNEGEV